MATHHAQTQLAGPVQIKVYKTNRSDKVPQTHEFTYLYKLPLWASLSTILASDIDLQRRFFVSRAFFNFIVTTADAAVVIVRIFLICV
jgi:hypothetical protein